MNNIIVYSKNNKKSHNTKKLRGFIQANYYFIKAKIQLS